MIDKRLKNKTLGPDDTEYNLLTRRTDLENELKKLSINDQNFSGFEFDSRNIRELINKKQIEKKIEEDVSNYEKYYEVVKYKILDGMISDFTLGLILQKITIRY